MENAQDESDDCCEIVSMTMTEPGRSENVYYTIEWAARLAEALGEAARLSDIPAGQQRRFRSVLFGTGMLGPGLRSADALGITKPFNLWVTMKLWKDGECVEQTCMLIPRTTDGQMGGICFEYGSDLNSWPQFGDTDWWQRVGIERLYQALSRLLWACECDDGKPIWRPDAGSGDPPPGFNAFLELALQDVNQRKDYSAAQDGKDVEYLWEVVQYYMALMKAKGYTFPEDQPDIFVRPDGSEGSVR